MLEILHRLYRLLILLSEQKSQAQNIIPSSNFLLCQIKSGFLNPVE